MFEKARKATKHLFENKYPGVVDIDLRESLKSLGHCPPALEKVKKAHKTPASNSLSQVSTGMDLSTVRTGSKSKPFPKSSQIHRQLRQRPAIDYKEPVQSEDDQEQDEELVEPHDQTDPATGETSERSIKPDLNTDRVSYHVAISHYQEMMNLLKTEHPGKNLPELHLDSWCVYVCA